MTVVIADKKHGQRQHDSTIEKNHPGVMASKTLYYT